MMADIGIDLTITALEPTALLARFRGGESDLYYTLFPGTVDPAKTVASLLSAQSPLNPGGYSNADVDKFALEGLAGNSIAERAPSYQKLSAAAALDRFHIPVCNSEAIYVGNSVFANLEATLGGSYDFRGLTPG
jgi:peptide/nickel transport system substrate-binding protein